MNQQQASYGQDKAASVPESAEPNYNWRLIYMLLLGFLVLIIVLLSWFTEVWS